MHFWFFERYMWFLCESYKILFYVFMQFASCLEAMLYWKGRIFLKQAINLKPYAFDINP